MNSPNDKTADASLRRRIAVAGELSHFFDTLGTSRPLLRFARRRSWHILAPRYLARLAFDAVESLRAVRPVPAFGDVERLIGVGTARMPQHSRYLAHWRDSERNSLVGLLIGVDAVYHDGRFHVLENNHGPTLKVERRRFHVGQFDPLVSKVAEWARDRGFSNVVPIGMRMPDYLIGEYAAQEDSFGVAARPLSCPYPHPEIDRVVSLPVPLARNSLYFILSGIHSPVSRLIDNKRSTAAWLGDALRDDLPAGTLVAFPRTGPSPPERLVDNGPRWPNLVVKLAESSKAEHVVAGRFENADEGRRQLRADDNGLPRVLSGGATSRFFTRPGEAIYQDYVPLELDERQRPRLLRVLLMISPLGALYLASYYRVGRVPVPDRAPAGLYRDGGPYVFNDDDYLQVPEALEDKLRVFAEQLGGAMSAAIERVFETSPGS